MTKVKEKIRSDVNTPLIWTQPPQDEPLTRTIERVAMRNPVFTDAELSAHGQQYADCLPRMVATGIIRQHGTHVFSSPLVDHSDDDVQHLIFFTGSKAVSREKLTRQTRRAAERRATQAAAIRAAPGADELQVMKAAIFDTEDAREYLNADPTAAIAKLVAANRVTAIHAGLYRGVKTREHGPEMERWIAKRSRRDAEVCRSLDDAFRATLSRLAPGSPVEPLRVTSMGEMSGTGRPIRIYVNFNRLGSIFAIAGGENKHYPLWRSDTKKTGLTNGAAKAIADEMFPAGMTFGELMAVHKAHSIAKHDVGLLPAFRKGGRFDECPRRGEKQEVRMRYDTIRKRDEQEAILHAPCVLSVDHREDAAIVEALRGLTNLALTDKTQLETADFHARWGKRPDQQLYIERKTATDFVASIADGRLASQIERMEALRDQGVPVCIVVQGNIYDLPATPVDSRGQPLRKAVLPLEVADATVDIGVAGIPTAHTERWQHTAQVIVRLIKGYMRRSLPPAEAHPRTEECATPEHIAAGPPAGPLSGSTRSGGDASPAM